MNNRNRNITTGIVLIALALCLIIWKLNVLNLPSAFVDISTWGLIIAAVMVIILVYSVINLWFGGIFFPIAIICIIFAEPLGITAITPEIVLIAALLLSIAFYMIFPRNGQPLKYSHGPGRFSESFAENFNVNGNGSVVYSTRFGSSTRYVRCQNLRSANLSSQFGEMTVFFDKAQVPDKIVYINCQVSFGEMDIYIPANWKVENKVSVTLGHFDNRGTNPGVANDAVTCVINGSVAFGEMKLIRI